MGRSVPRRYPAPRGPRVPASGVGWANPEGKPRPGFGIVYVMPGSPSPRLPEDLLWSAEWIDEFTEPDEHGEMAGIETFSGGRAEVLAWARSRPAQERMIPIEADPIWVPLPDDDADVRP